MSCNASSILDPLSLKESVDMLGFRCQRAGIRNPYEPAAVEAVYRVTGGVPREVLKVCSISLEMA